MKEKRVPKTIPEIIKAISESSDSNTIEMMENYLGCYYAIPILFIGAIINIILNYKLKNSIIDSVILLILCLGFIKMPHLTLKTRIVTHWISILYSFILVFVTIRIYKFIGPAIWTIVFINIMICSTRITRIMLNYISVCTLFIGMYFTLVLSKIPFEYTIVYSILQWVLIALIIVIVPALHLINKAHHDRVSNMYIVEVEQREELETMYEKIASTHAELRLRYDELNNKNIELKQNEEKLYHLAHFDIVTGLPNRKAVIDKINELIKRSNQELISFYIVFIDIDSFKKINDTMGHHIGDLFIIDAATRLSKNIVKEDLIGRIGGDEFALIIQRNICRKEAYHYLERLRKEFLKPFLIETNEIKMSASFGVAAFKTDGVGQVELMSHADTAMYKAKELGKNNIQFFESYMKQELLDKINFETELKSALLNNEFYLEFQPVYHLKQQRIRGFEVLARWKSNKFGMVSPDKFIPVAEELGMIVSLGEWILKTACKTFKRLQNQYQLNTVLAINLSVRQLETPNIVEMIEEALIQADLNPKYLEIEVTESVLIHSIEDSLAILERLRKKGISIALDDFGTGYSSLNYLRKLPIDILKIDKSFIDDLLTETKDIQIIGTMITLAHDLGISVVAEGIEEKIQVEHLKKLGCDYIQGFYISRPLIESRLEEYIVSTIK